MSDLARSGRAWHLYIDDMITFAEKALASTDGMGQAEFKEHGLTLMPQCAIGS